VSTLQIAAGYCTHNASRLRKRYENGGGEWGSLVFDPGREEILI